MREEGLNFRDGLTAYQIDWITRGIPARHRKAKARNPADEHKIIRFKYFSKRPKDRDRVCTAAGEADQAGSTSSMAP